MNPLTGARLPHRYVVATTRLTLYPVLAHRFDQRESHHNEGFTPTTFLTDDKAALGLACKALDFICGLGFSLRHHAQGSEQRLGFRPIAHHVDRPLK